MVKVQRQPKNHLKRLLEKLRQDLPELRTRYGVRSMGVFGSYVHGKQKRGSDLDIVVEIDERSLTLFQFLELENLLRERLGVDIDLVEKSTLKPMIGRHILEEVVPV